MRYSKRMKRRPGRSSKSLTYRFPSSIRGWLPILRTLFPSFTSFGRLPDRSCRRTITCTPIGIHPPCSTTSLLTSWGGEVVIKYSTPCVRQRRGVRGLILSLLENVILDTVLAENRYSDTSHDITEQGTSTHQRDNARE